MPFGSRTTILEEMTEHEDSHRSLLKRATDFPQPMPRKRVKAMPDPKISDTGSNLGILTDTVTEDTMLWTPDETPRAEVSEISLHGTSNEVHDVDKEQGEVNGAGNGHECFSRYHHGVIEGTVSGVPWTYDPKHAPPNYLYDPCQVYSQRPQDFRWTCCGEGPYSEGCGFDFDNIQDGDDGEANCCRSVGIDAVVNACESLVENCLDDDAKAFIKEKLWYDI